MASFRCALAAALTAAALTAGAAVAQPANDLCAGATVVPGLPFSRAVTGLNLATDDVDNDCNLGSAATRRGVWFEYTPASDCQLAITETGSLDTVIAVFSGSCGGLVQRYCSDPEDIVATLAAGTTYRILVGAWSDPTVTASSTYVVNLQSCAPVLTPAPSNDLCANATAISSFPFTDTVNGTTASVDADSDCNIGNIGVQNGVWYTLTAPATGVVTLSEGSSTDTVATAFTGGCDGLTAVHCSDPESSRFGVVAGVHYRILLGYWWQSSLALTAPAYSFTVDFLLAPPNDQCASAAPLTLGTPVTSSTLLATSTGDGPAPSCQSSVTNGVWFAFTPSRTGTYRLDSCGSSHDTVITVFTGGCASLSQVACADDDGPACDTTRASLDATLAAGTPYLVRLQTYGSSTPGPFTLLLSRSDPVGACCRASACELLTADECAGAGGAFRGEGSGCAGPQTSETPNVTIEDGDEETMTAFVVTRTLNVTEAGALTDVDVLVDMEHSWTGDVSVRLTSPAGTTVTLLNRPDGDSTTPTCPAGPFIDAGTSNDLDGAYLFDDSATVSLNAAVLDADRPPSGSYRAANCDGVLVSLNTAFGGQSMTGVWTLEVVDQDGVGDGTLRRWALTLNGGARPCVATCRADFNGSGAVDVADIFAFLSAWFSNAAGSDFNESGATDVADIFAFLSAWFAGCP